jgi:formylglycine-generating enzyme required for sulfatase activity
MSHLADNVNVASGAGWYGSARCYRKDFRHPQEPKLTGSHGGSRRPARNAGINDILVTQDSEAC